MVPKLAHEYIEWIVKIIFWILNNDTSKDTIKKYSERIMQANVVHHLIFFIIISAILTLKVFNYKILFEIII